MSAVHCYANLHGGVSLSTGARLARGCRDVHAASARRRHRLVSKFSELASLYGCSPIETPILEPATLYASLGATSDINVSETYRLMDTDPQLVLRPEGTAGVARALRETLKGKAHGTRVWYAGPMFRRERPQAGRFRQFTQLGVEFVDSIQVNTSGNLQPLADADAISLMYKFFTSIGIDPTVRMNTLGTAVQRANFNESLTKYLTPRRDRLSTLSRRRLDTGMCMRILDSKNSQDIDTLQGAPCLREFQSAETIEAFENVCLLLQQNGVPYLIDETLVRGLDYYTSTAFELDNGNTGRALAAGGRYSGVVEEISGVGFAVGLERVETLVSEMDNISDDNDEIIFVIALGDVDSCKSEVLNASCRAVESLRKAGVPAVLRPEVAHVSKCLGRAVREGAHAVIIIGSDEVVNNAARVKFIVGQDKKNMKFEAPELVGLDNIGDYIRKQMVENRISNKAEERRGCEQSEDIRQNFESN